jgi:hypothetical protein
MKIRSLLLGSVAAAGLATTGYAADLGVVTSLDICDELGVSGLTVSSDENCLVISGGVSFEYSLGDSDGVVAVAVAPANADALEVDTPNGVLDSSLDIDAWLQFVGKANSDFGMATATIQLISEDKDGVDDDPDPNDTDEWDVEVGEAWVGIGDTTVLMAGKRDSIFNQDDDTALDYLGLVGGDADLTDPEPAVLGGNVIQLTHALGNGLSIGGAIENLMTSAAANPTFVGVLAYAGDGITAHASGAADLAGNWDAHAGFTGSWDPIKVVGAVAADSNGWWNVIGSASATFDMFTLAASGEATSMGEWGASGSASATVSEGVTINLGGRYFDDTANQAWQVEAGVKAAVTETLTLTAAIGAINSTNAAANNFYGKGGLEWNPGGNFKAGIAGEANSLGAYKATFTASKDIK